MRMLDNLKTNKERVYALLEKYPECRDSDKILWLVYMNKYFDLRASLGDKHYKILKNILLNEDSPSFESLSRLRRKTQETSFAGKSRDKRKLEQESVRLWSKN